MSRFSETVRDERGHAIPNVTVYVYEWDYPSDTTGALSALTDDDLVTALPNPLTTDEFGEFYFNTDDGLKMLEYHYGGKLLYREQAILTPTGVYPGNDATLRADLAAPGGPALISADDGASGSVFTTVAGFIAKLLSSAGTSIVGFIHSGAGPVQRSLQAKLRDTASPEDYGATNGSNDSASLSAAITAKGQPSLAAGKSYTVKDVALTNNQAVTGTGQSVTAASGGTNVFVLSDFNPRLTGLYFISGANASEAVIRIKKSRYASVSNISVIDCGPGFIKLVPTTPATEINALASIANADAEDITGTGISIGSSSSESRWSNVHLYGKTTAGTGGTRPIFTSVGWRQNTPVVGTPSIAVGGHQAVNMNMITFNRGYHLTDAQFTKISNSFADSCSDYGVLLDGACNDIEFADLTVGTTRGVKVMGTCQVIHFNGLKTTLTGSIPSWGSTDFYNGVGTFYDLEVRDTAQVRVSNWSGSKRILVDAGAKLVVDGGITVQGRSVANVAASSTVYLNEAGAQSSESIAVWRAPYDSYLIRISATSDNNPGAGQSFTYTARVGAADSTLTQTISGASSTGGTDTWAGTLIPVTKGQIVSVKLVTSAGANATGHQVQVQLVPR